jgi:hypothetical protein
MRTNLRRLRATPCLLALLLLVACDVETDRSQYAAGQSGVATFRNTLGATLFLAGCAHFEYEKLVAGRWVSQGSDIACFWEGHAQPVQPGEEVADPIRAREAGTWRLRYDVGVGCSAKRPLQRCDRRFEVTSNEFEVVASGGSGCAVAGCSGQLCLEAHLADDLATTCEWLPEYACLRDARCGPFGPGGACGWEETPELLECLERAGSAK